MKIDSCNVKNKLRSEHMNERVFGIMKMEKYDISIILYDDPLIENNLNSSIIDNYDLKKIIKNEKKIESE
jgi:hypothetical protein